MLEPVRAGVGDALTGDTESLREDLNEPAGALIVLALALLHSVVWYPAEILDAAAGYVFGFWVATPLVMGGWLLNGLVCWLVGRNVARPLLVRWLGEERFGRYEDAVARGGVTLLIGMRLVPVVPFSLFSYAAGSARVPLGRFLWTTAVGYLPLTALFTYLGSRLEELSLDDPLLWAGVARPARAAAPDPHGDALVRGAAATGTKEQPELRGDVTEKGTPGVNYSVDDPGRRRRGSRPRSGESSSCIAAAGTVDDDRRRREVELDREVVVGETISSAAAETGPPPTARAPARGSRRRSRAGSPRSPPGRGSPRLRAKRSAYCHWRPCSPAAVAASAGSVVSRPVIATWRSSKLASPSRA